MAHKVPKPAQIGRQVQKNLREGVRYWDAVAGRIITLGKFPNLRGGYQEMLEEPVGVVRRVVGTSGSGLTLTAGFNAGVSFNLYSSQPSTSEYFNWSVSWSGGDYDPDTGEQTPPPSGAGSGSGVEFEQRWAFEFVSLSESNAVFNVTTGDGGGVFQAIVTGGTGATEYIAYIDFYVSDAVTWERGHEVDGAFVRDELLTDYAGVEAFKLPTRWKYFPAMNQLRRVSRFGVVESVAAQSGVWVQIKPGRWVSPAGKLFFQWVPR
jgi:hypothetical protein